MTYDEAMDKAWAHMDINTAVDVRTTIRTHVARLERERDDLSKALETVRGNVDLLRAAVKIQRTEGYRAGVEAAAKVVEREWREWFTGASTMLAASEAIRALTPPPPPKEEP